MSEYDDYPEDARPRSSKTVYGDVYNEPKQSHEEGTVIVEQYPDGKTKKIRLDLEIDTSNKDIATNPYSKSIYLAQAFDAWRPFPRLFIIVYMWIVFRTVEWYIVLPDPTMEQSGFVSVIVGAGAAWFGLYVGSGRGRFKGPDKD